MVASGENWPDDPRFYAWLYRLAHGLPLGTDPEGERLIQKALNRLSPEHKIVLVLKDMEKQKFEDIADILQIPIGTVRSRLHRARLELRDLLQREDGDQR